MFYFILFCFVLLITQFTRIGFCTETDFSFRYFCELPYVRTLFVGTNSTLHCIWGLRSMVNDNIDKDWYPSPPLLFRVACYSSIYLCFIRIVWVELLIAVKRISRVVDSIYKPGGCLTISNPNIAPTSIGVDDDSYGLGWWSSVTFGGKNNIKVIVISAYRTCILIENMEVSTVHLQKLDSIE